MPDPNDFCDAHDEILQAWEDASDEEIAAWDELQEAGRELESAYWKTGKAIIKTNLFGLLGGATVMVSKTLAIAATSWAMSVADKTDGSIEKQDAFTKAAAKYNAAYANFVAKKKAEQEAYQDLCDCESGD